MAHASSGSDRHILQLQVQAQQEERQKERETNWQKVQAQQEERQGEQERKRQKVQDEKEESGVGFSVEHLELNSGIPENAAKLEDYQDDYYNGPHCSNETHPEAIEHHAGEIAYTWYDWLTNELICPVDACLPPVMTYISSTRSLR